MKIRPRVAITRTMEETTVSEGAWRRVKPSGVFSIFMSFFSPFEHIRVMLAVVVGGQIVGGLHDQVLGVPDEDTPGEHTHNAESQHLTAADIHGYALPDSRAGEAVGGLEPPEDGEKTAGEEGEKDVEQDTLVVLAVVLAEGIDVLCPMVEVPELVDTEGDDGEEEELEEGAVVFDGLHGGVSFLM